MKFFTTIISTLLIIFTINIAVAQNNMKAPVRFKLKNGVTLIVAQNAGMGKVYARLTVENEATALNNDTATLITNVLAQKAIEFNKMAYPLNGEVAPMNLQFAEANTAARINDFEDALTVAVSAIFNPEFSQEATSKFDTHKSLTAEQLKAYHKNAIKTSDTYLTIAGDISVADAKMLVNKIFGNWKEVAKL